MLQKTSHRSTTQRKGIFNQPFAFTHNSKLFSLKILLQLFVYSMTFSILLVGLKSYSKSQTSNNSLQDVKNATNIQEDIANNVVRLHVIANSDTDADQSLKLAVRDEIITSLQENLKHASSVAQAKEIIARQQSQIQADAQKVITAHNCNYSVNVSLNQRYFPVKQYGDMTFPAGTYQALCVEIGTAKGHNWWCVLFPSLCFVNETTAIVPDESKEKLKESLSEDAYDSLYENNEKPEVRSGILDWFGNSEQ